MTFTLFSKEITPKVFKMIKREAVWSQSKHQNTLKDGFTKKLDDSIAERFKKKRETKAYNKQQFKNETSKVH